MNDLTVVSVFFNPAQFKQPIKNFELYAENLYKNNIPLITVGLDFGDKSCGVKTDYKLKSHSIMWQKECLINYALERVKTKYFAWVDADLLFPDGWYEQTLEKLEINNIVQLFKRVVYLPKGHTVYTGERIQLLQGIIWQYKTHKNWLKRRLVKDLNFAAPGFAWAAHTSLFPNGLYDKCISGSGDTFLCDLLLGSERLHSYFGKMTDRMKEDRELFKNSLDEFKFDYLPIEIHHLQHGELKNRNYTDRHDILKKYEFDPQKDIIKVDGVYEWATNKPGLREELKNYFSERKEDE